MRVTLQVCCRIGIPQQPECAPSAPEEIPPTEVFERPLKTFIGTIFCISPPVEQGIFSAFNPQQERKIITDPFQKPLKMT